MNKQYIITIELWRGGACSSWQQAAMDCEPWESAIAILDKIREAFKQEGYVVKVTDIFKL